MNVVMKEEINYKFSVIFDLIRTFHPRIIVVLRSIDDL